VKGEDVRRLQEILIKEGVWGASEIGATGYFGPITKEAVIRFQEKYQKEILWPLGLSKGTGFVGPLTRQFLRRYQKKENEKEFCGWSTYGRCKVDGDCYRGGCSRQVCQSKFESPVITTCEWKECYDPKPYHLICKCVEEKCQWAK